MLGLSYWCSWWNCSSQNVSYDIGIRKQDHIPTCVVLPQCCTSDMETKLKCCCSFSTEMLKYHPGTTCRYEAVRRGPGADLWAHEGQREYTFKICDSTENHHHKLDISGQVRDMCVSNPCFAHRNPDPETEVCQHFIWVCDFLFSPSYVSFLLYWYNYSALKSMKPLNSQMLPDAQLRHYKILPWSIF